MSIQALRARLDKLTPPPQRVTITGFRVVARDKAPDYGRPVFPGSCFWLAPAAETAAEKQS